MCRHLKLVAFLKSLFVKVHSRLCKCPSYDLFNSVECGSLSDAAQRRHLLAPHEYDAESKGAEQYDGQVDLARRSRRDEGEGEEAPRDDTYHGDGEVAEYEPPEHGVGLK